jgi:hypothetical protein
LELDGLNCRVGLDQRADIMSSPTFSVPFPSMNLYKATSWGTTKSVILSATLSWLQLPALLEKPHNVLHPVGFFSWCFTRNRSVLSADPGCQLFGPWVQHGWGHRRRRDYLWAEKLISRRDGREVKTNNIFGESQNLTHSILWLNPRTKSFLCDSACLSVLLDFSRILFILFISVKNVWFLC